MDRQNRANARIILADSDAYMRQSLLHALTHEGYRDIRSVSRLTLLVDLLRGSMPDLLIMDIDMADGDAIELVRDIRNGKIGRNPFLPIILMSWDSDRPLIRRVVDSGADMLVAKPLAPVQLLERMDFIVRQRNPFIVTADYFGPDRRMDNSSGEIERYMVPNTLKDKIEGRPVDYASLHEQIQSTFGQMNKLRLVEDAARITSIVGIVTNSYKQKRLSKETKSRMDQIICCTEDFAGRIAGTPFESLSGVCASLLKAARHIHRRPKKADRKQVDLLQPLADTIRVGVDPDQDSESGIQEVDHIVDNGRMSAPNQPLPQV